MLNYQIMDREGIVIVEPRGPLNEGDFEELTANVDLYLEQHGKLRGLLIHVKTFPGWESIAGMISHFRFVRDHHEQIEKVAVSSDSVQAPILPGLARHFIKAKIKHFDYDQRKEAMEWLIKDT